MKNIILFDDETREALLPFSYTRPVAEIPVGFLSIAQKWQYHFDAPVSYITQDYLSRKYPIEIADDNLIINASALPNDKIVALIKQLDPNESLMQEDELIAARLNSHQFDLLIKDDFLEELIGYEIKDEDAFRKVNHIWEITQFGKEESILDYKLMTSAKTSQEISDTNGLVNKNQIFLEEGVQMEHCLLDASSGPIYISKNAVVLQGSMLKGPIFLGEGTVVKMGAKIYGSTFIGPNCKVGGEIKNSVFIANSNKSHDGYIGDSVIGAWCNLGADSNCSNLKNNYGEIKIWNYGSESFENSAQQFAGLFLGDHCKTAIATKFNTGTVAGIFSNIYGDGFHDKFIPSFSWGADHEYQFEKAIDTLKKVYERKNKTLDEIEIFILEFIFQYTSKFRSKKENG